MKDDFFFLFRQFFQLLNSAGKTERKRIVRDIDILEAEKMVRRNAEDNRETDNHFIREMSFTSFIISNLFLRKTHEASEFLLSKSFRFTELSNTLSCRERLNRDRGIFRNRRHNKKYTVILTYIP